MYLAFPFPKRHYKMHPAVVTMPKKTISKAEATADAVMDLFAQEAGRGSRAAHHALQCALLAMEALSDLPVIVAALLHQVDTMYQTPPLQSASSILQSLGFSERVCAIVALQPNVKQYFAQTLPAAEATALENHPFFSDSLALGRWAAQAHTSTIEALPLSFFRRLVWDHLSCRVA